MRKPIHLKRIVCVDDNAFVLKILQWYLETRGYLAVPYLNGREALNAIAKGGADAVVLDYHMPDINGGQVAAAIRSRSPRTPIVLFSGETDVPAESLALMDNFVQKGEPNAFSAVGDFLDSLLSRHEQKRLERKTARDNRSVLRARRRAVAA
jgi:CheY-like chemotaxis protein